jgi:hypothetical protein
MNTQNVSPRLETWQDSNRNLAIPICMPKKTSKKARTRHFGLLMYFVNSYQSFC